MIYDALATLVLITLAIWAAAIPIALIAWFSRSKPADTRPRRVPQSWDRPPLTSEWLDE